MKQFLVVFSFCALLLAGCQASEAETLSLQGANGTVVLSLSMTQEKAEKQLGSPVDCYTPEDWADEEGFIPIFQEDNQGNPLSQTNETVFCYESEENGQIYVTYDDQDRINSISTYCLYANRPAAFFLWHISDTITYGTTLDTVKTMYPDATITTDETLGYDYVQVASGDSGLLAVFSDEKVISLCLCPKDALFL